MRFKADEIASVIQTGSRAVRVPHRRPRSRPRHRGRRRHRAAYTAFRTSWPARWSSSPDDIYGLAFNLEETSVGVIILGDYLKIAEGDEVKLTGRLLSVPVGEAVLGRMLDPLGNPLDGKARRSSRERRPVEANRPWHRPAAAGQAALQTGIKAIDAMTPIGRGQRELIIGDRQHRQDGHLHRYDHQPEEHRREVLLRRGGPEGIEHRRACGNLPHATGRWTTRRSSLPAPADPGRCNTSLPTPAARWPSSSCTRARTP